MNDFQKRLATITYIIDREKKIGKTALTKILFVTQERFNVPLKYNFSLYLYGPYTAEISSEIAYLDCSGLICNKAELINNYIAYDLTTIDNITANVYGENRDFIEEYKNVINNVVDYMSGMPVKELELVATLVFAWSRFFKEKNKVVKKVQEIKPHFAQKEITEKFDELLQKDFLTA